MMAQFKNGFACLLTVLCGAVSVSAFTTKDGETRLADRGCAHRTNRLLVSPVGPTEYYRIYGR